MVLASAVKGFVHLRDILLVDQEAMHRVTGMTGFYSD
jgi:hypothetical protein